MMDRRVHPLFDPVPQECISILYLLSREIDIKQLESKGDYINLMLIRRITVTRYDWGSKKQIPCR